MRFGFPSRSAFLSRPDPREASDFSNRRGLALVALAVAVGAVLRVWGLQFGFPFPFARTDEEVIVDVGLGVLRDPNPHFFDWPTLFMYALGGVYAALFTVERLVGGAIRNATVAKLFHLTTLHLTARILSAAAGTCSIALLYSTVREVLSRRVAVLAAALLAVVYLHVRDSHFGVTDVPATLMMLLAMRAGVRCATRGISTRRLATAGLLSGLAASTKYNTALVLLTPMIAIAADTFSRRRPIGMTARDAALVAVAFTAGFVIGTPYAVLDFPAFWRGISAVRSHLGGGHVVMARGWTYHASLTLPFGVGVPMLLAAVAGAVWLAIDAPFAAVLLLAVPVAYYVLLGSGRTVFARYMLPIVPFMCVSAAYLVDRSARTFAGWKTPAARVAVTFAGLAIIAAPTLADSIAFDRLMTKTDTRVLGGNWIAAAAPEGASLYQTGFGGGQLQPAPADRYLRYAFNEHLSRFEVGGGPATALPDFVVILESPLSAYSTVPSAIRTIVADAYDQAMVIDGTPAASTPGVQYNLDDAFYAPYAGMDRAVRPGPTVRIYRRR